MMAWVPEQFDEESTPSWFSSVWAEEAAQKAGTLPKWVDAGRLPHIIIEERRLADAQVRTVLAALRESEVGHPHPLIKQLRKHGLATSLDQFASKLLEAWEEGCSPSSDHWAVAAVGCLGFDDAAARLAARIRSWSDGKRKLAKLALESLLAIRTDGALMQLDSLSRSSQFRWVKELARDQLQDAAIDRNIAVEEMADRAIPDCGLDAKGTRPFELNGRVFHFTLGPGLKPMLRADDGKISSSLPRPKKTDDPAASAQVRAEWDAAKRQVGQVAKLQAARLKKAIAQARRWTVPAFTELVRHPLMGHIVRGVIWGLYDTKDCPPGWGAGRLREAFRVTQEADFATVDDEPFAFADEPALRIGVAHPIHLNESQRLAWAQVLGDYELLAPFPQITRPVYELTPEERGAEELTRFADARIPSPVFFAISGNMGYVPLPDGGDQGFTKTVADVTIVLDSSGDGPWGKSSIPRCRFLHAPYVKQPGKGSMLKPGEIDPAIASEVMREVYGIIAAGAKEKT